jgi:branched-chain amino acid transport system substrate-binding protein
MEGPLKRRSALLGLAAAASTVGVPRWALADEDGISGKTVYVGVSNIESGNAAFYRAQGEAIKYHLTYQNSLGGVNGYQFNVELLDNQLTPAGGAQTVRQFLNEKKFAIFVIGTPAAAGAVSVLQDSGKDVPVLASGATALIKKLRTDGTLSNLFGEFPNFDTGALFDMNFLIKTLGKKNVAIVYEDTAVGQGAGTMAPDYAKKIGAQSVQALAVAPSATDLGPTAARLKAANVEAVDVVARASILVELQKAAAAIGYHPAWMSYAPNLSTSYLSLAGAAGEGTYFQSFMEALTDSTPDVKLFHDQMQKFDANNDNEVAQAGWVLGGIAIRGVEIATQHGKPLTRQGFMSALTQLHGQKVGMALQVGYTEADHASSATSLSVYQVKNGRFVKVSDPRPIPSA